MLTTNEEEEEEKLASVWRKRRPGQHGAHAHAHGTTSTCRWSSPESAPSAAALRCARCCSGPSSCDSTAASRPRLECCAPTNTRQGSALPCSARKCRRANKQAREASVPVPVPVPVPGLEDWRPAGWGVAGAHVCGEPWKCTGLRAWVSAPQSRATVCHGELLLLNQQSSTAERARCTFEQSSNELSVAVNTRSGHSE